MSINTLFAIAFIFLIIANLAMFTLINLFIAGGLSLLLYFSVFPAIRAERDREADKEDF